ncbi:MAG: hypothetical protein Q8M83_00540 [bacterium]|nr:hypothetical protein [bacterium]
MPFNTEEAQRKRNFDAGQQQARLANPPKDESSPEQENPDETTSEPEADGAPTPSLAGAAKAAEQALEKSPEQKAAEEMIAKVPFGQALLKSVPVFGWLLGVMRESVVALWWLIPPFWAGASFLSIIGLRGFKLPWLPTKIPKTTAFECLLSQLVFYVEISPFILVVVGLVALLVYVKQNPTSAIYGIFFGPFEFLKPLLPYVLGS